MLFWVVTALALGAYFFVYSTYVRRKAFRGTVKLHGKTVIVTGSNTGIGKATALDLAKRGARVILACRSKQRAEAALQEIRRESGNNEVIFMQLDLGSLKSIRSFAENFLKSEPRLDLLINNAALGAPGRTEDGLGMILGVNHIGPFLLTNLLLDRLKECAPSRVVNVASYMHEFGEIDFNCINRHKCLGLGTSTLDITKIYSHSKLCNVLFTHELAQRLKGTNVTCYSLHPGSVATELDRNSKDSWYVFIFRPIFRNMFMTDPMSGAQTTLYCALQEGIEPLSGRYFSNCTLTEVKQKAKDDIVARKLWEVSERLCGMA
ncbi:dehydrogenase/reductase SDR family member 13 isoform X1 [Chanos chanos]|uniref:Dehydrogenase/reductase SDR family member 13 isoform X1 n=1 Tax=Chanos chanos TaxID=29144 RepID=A0A6J2VXN3_CHACN|nr:dehydrogenase/reductase SDR family member 13-like isoform X1 [Chanos chanos]